MINLEKHTLQIRLAQFDSGSRLHNNARTLPRVRAFFLFAHLAHSQHTFDVAKHLRHAVQKTCFLLNRHMVLAIGNDGQFERFCIASGHSEVALDPAYKTNPARVKNRQTLVPMLTAWTMQRDTAEWGQLLDSVSVPCSPILDVERVMKHPHVLARKMKITSASSSIPPMIANPMLMDGQRMTSELAPPGLGSGVASWLRKSG
jgi:crotonobetainyl-CoA:carnitine CoA-transferase CaiB-like acyl-CoA transferase